MRLTLYAEHFFGAVVGQPLFSNQVRHWIGFCVKEREMCGPGAAFSLYQCKIVNPRARKRHIRLERISRLGTDSKEMR